MLATWYDRQGPAAEVLLTGEMPDPTPAAGEVRVRQATSGVNPGDTKKRAGWLGGGSMAYPRVIPHSDGAGVIDAVGVGVDSDRVGRRVWVYGAQSYRPFGTAAQLTTVPEHQAIDLPSTVADEVGATLGIPGITAHRVVFADGPVDGSHILVHATRADRPTIPFWPMLFNNVTLRLMGSDDFPMAAKVAAAQDLTHAAAESALHTVIAARFPLDAVADGHDYVDSGSRGRALIMIPT